MGGSNVTVKTCDDVSCRYERGSLNRENDALREIVIKAVTTGHPVKVGADNGKAAVWISLQLWRKISRGQVSHRKDDLARLEATLRSLLKNFFPHELTGKFTRPELQRMLGAVLTADPEFQLEAQLGFDPDSI